MASIPHLKSFYKSAFSTLQSRKTKSNHQKFDWTIRNIKKIPNISDKKISFIPRSKKKKNPIYLLIT